jgi:signal transduction histidine kinase
LILHVPEEVIIKACYGIVLVFILFMSGAVIHLNDKGDLQVPTTGSDCYRIDHTVISSSEQSEFIASWYSIGDDVDVKSVSDNTTPGSKTFRIVPYYSNIEIIISIITAVVICLVGFSVYLLRPNQPATLLFYLSSVSTSIALLGVKTIYAVSPAWFGSFLAFIFFLAYGLTPVLFLHFTFLFPVPHGKIKRKYLAIGYLLCVLVAFCHVFIYLAAARNHSIQGFERASIVSTFQNGLAFVFLTAGVVKILMSYTRTQSTSDRRKIRLVIFGLTVGTTPFIFLWVLPQTFGVAPYIPEYLFKLFLLFIPCMFALSVLRYKLLDVDLLIHRGAVYSLAIGLVMLIYALLVGGLTFLIGKEITMLSPVYSGLAAVLIAILFQPMKNRVQQFVNKYFFRIEYNYREALRKMIGDVKECIDLGSIADCLVRGIDELLFVEKIGVFVLDGPSQYLRLYAHHGLPLLEKHGVRFEKENLKSSLRLPVGIPDYIEPSVEYEAADSEVFKRWGIVLVCPLLARREEALGFLALGQKKSGVRFTEEDIDLVASIGHQAGVAIERLLLQNKVILEHAEAERLDELNKMKSYFVSSVSHDMKTPLTSIKMFAELLRTKPRPEHEVQYFLKIIENESDRLTRLINTVLDFSKIERGVKEYHLKKLELNAHVAGVLESMNYQLAAEHVDLSTDFHPQSLFIEADGDALTEAVINILSNAVKYSRDVKEIAISTGRKDAFAVLKISDKGIGIEPENIRKIFQPFFQTVKARERGAGGVGLGLSIVKHIMDGHRGIIDVQSIPDKGTTMTLHFPLIPEDGVDL